MREKLGSKGMGQKVVFADGFFSLQEPEICYTVDSTPENGVLRQENICYWDVFTSNSTT